MNQYKHKNFGIAVLAALVMLLVASGVVFAASGAQTEPPVFEENDNEEPYWGPMHGRRGGWSQEPPFPLIHEALVEAVADAIDVPVDEINARLADGERLIAIALDAGITRDAFFELVVEVREAVLTEAFEAGLISEEQYQWMLEGPQGERFEGRFGGCHPDGPPIWGRGFGRGRGGRW